jgi:capsid protein
MAPKFYEPLMKEALSACSWIGASRGQIDELKETQAAVLRIKTGLSTLEIEASRLGLDWREIISQKAREKKMIDAAGLNFSDETTKPGTLAGGDRRSGTGQADNQRDNEENE